MQVRREHEVPAPAGQVAAVHRSARGRGEEGVQPRVRAGFAGFPGLAEARRPSRAGGQQAPVVQRVRARRRGALDAARCRPGCGWRRGSAAGAHERRIDAVGAAGLGADRVEVEQGGGAVQVQRHRVARPPPRRAGPRARASARRGPPWPRSPAPGAGFPRPTARAAGPAPRRAWRGTRRVPRGCGAATSARRRLAPTRRRSPRRARRRAAPAGRSRRPPARAAWSLRRRSWRNHSRTGATAGCSGIDCRFARVLALVKERACFGRNVRWGTTTWRCGNRQPRGPPGARATCATGPRCSGPRRSRADECRSLHRQSPRWERCAAVALAKRGYRGERRGNATGRPSRRPTIRRP